MKCIPLVCLISTPNTHSFSSLPRVFAVAKVLESACEQSWKKMDVDMYTMRRLEHPASQLCTSTSNPPRISSSLSPHVCTLACTLGHSSLTTLCHRHAQADHENRGGSLKLTPVLGASQRRSARGHRRPAAQSRQTGHGTLSLCVSVCVCVCVCRERA